MPIQYEGKRYDVVSQDKFTLGEVDAVERATGLTLQKIRHMGRTCVCEHDLEAHTHKDDQGEQTEDRSCVKCSCQSHAGDVPMRVQSAFAWVSVKRGVPELTFNQFSGLPVDGLFVDDEADASDPTGRPQPEESLT